ncbi:acyltransferase [Nocardioides oceani]|uniref:acyltransferase n=1 Tax=Nocardioides oceani TaxID=3058369 RepID=UPI0034DE6AB9
MRGLRIGERCAIGWNTHFLDENFHQLHGQVSGARIEVGDDVWIGSGVTVLPGARIPDGCVVAANATVVGVFDEPRCLLAGLPARVIRRDVEWEYEHPIERTV